MGGGGQKNEFRHIFITFFISKERSDQSLRSSMDKTI